MLACPFRQKSTAEQLCLSEPVCTWACWTGQWAGQWAVRTGFVEWHIHRPRTRSPAQASYIIPMDYQLTTRRVQGKAAVCYWWRPRGRR